VTARAQNPDARVESRCPHCAAVLGTPLGCAACGRLLELPREPSPFEVFALPVQFDVDKKSLRKRLLEISRLTHPDFFGTASSELKQRAERASARLNSAHEILADDACRSDWLIAHLGGPDENEERQMPQPFLMEVLEWNEQLEEARKSRAPLSSELSTLEQSLRERREEALAAVRSALVPLPERGSQRLRDARRELNAIRYIDRALAEVEALRLANPARS
jgi:molecular chaperone HscB